MEGFDSILWDGREGLESFRDIIRAKDSKFCSFTGIFVRGNVVSQSGIG